MSERTERFIATCIVSVLFAALIFVVAYWVSEGVQTLSRTRAGRSVSYWLSEPNDMEAK